MKFIRRLRKTDGKIVGTNCVRPRGRPQVFPTVNGFVKRRYPLFSIFVFPHITYYEV